MNDFLKIKKVKMFFTFFFNTKKKSVPGLKAWRMKFFCIYVLMHKKVNRDAGVMGDSIYRFYSSKALQNRSQMLTSGTILEGGVLFIDQQFTLWAKLIEAGFNPRTWVTIALFGGTSQ